MALYLLDTSAFSALMGEDPATLQRMASIGSDDQLAICTTVRGEIRYGLARMPEGGRRRRFEAKVASLFAQIPCLPLRERVGDAYGRLKRASEQRGLPLDENDLWIAATALAHDAILVTSDSDFQRVSGLAVEDWSR